MEGWLNDCSGNPGQNRGAMGLNFERVGTESVAPMLFFDWVQVLPLFCAKLLLLKAHGGKPLKSIEKSNKSEAGKKLLGKNFVEPM